VEKTKPIVEKCEMEDWLDREEYPFIEMKEQQYYPGDKVPEVVIPAKAGISSRYDGRMLPDPGFRDCVTIIVSVPFLAVMPAEAGISSG
jgi:hypothetical protein